MLRGHRLQFHCSFNIRFKFTQSTQKPLSFLVKVSTDSGNYLLKIRKDGKLKKWVIVSDLNSLPAYMPLLADHIGDLIKTELNLNSNLESYSAR